MQELSVIVLRGHKLKGMGQVSGGRAGEKSREFRFQKRRGQGGGKSLETSQLLDSLSLAGLLLIQIENHGS